MVGARHPALERCKYFTILLYHSTEVDPIDIFLNGATAIEFSGNNGSKSLHHWEEQYQFDRPI
jgi:hypothetical protein